MEEKPEEKPWHNPKGGFRNPWPSSHTAGFTEFFSALREWDRKPLPPPEQRTPRVPVDWERVKNPPTEPGHLQLTWLGHASFLLQMNGLNILLDPIFSHRCAPFQWIGPARFTDPACGLSELPPTDAVIISHNHYDHLDQNTITSLGDRPRYFVPLGNKQWFTSRGFTNVSELDWWESEEFKGVKITCTPCQHFSGRWLHDRDRTLWASWTVHGDSTSFFFGGDTGYRYVPRGFDDKKEDRNQLPSCPAFKEIGEKMGPFDLACLPIGAYSPRFVMSGVHCDPEDAVCVHMDIRSRQSIGMHWGTFVLTDEDVREPPIKLKEALQRKGLREDEFTTLAIGQTTQVQRQ